LDTNTSKEVVFLLTDAGCAMLEVVVALCESNQHLVY
jgi:hypothetical protein